MKSGKKDIEMQLTTPLVHQKYQDQNTSNYDITRAAHPCICFFHLFFKFCAFFSYLFLGLFLSDQLMQYILILLFNAFDFYCVKNITGRYLVGLRWYSDFGPKGEEVWKFESYDLSKRSKIDSSIFWTFQFSASCGWAFFFFTNIISLGIIDMVFAGVGASLSWINLWGFYRSSKDQQRKMKDMQNYLTKQGLKYMIK